MQRPFILSIVGKSDSGKTTLILKLLPELRRKGYRVAVAKNCPHGFDLDVEGKDSWKFSKAGGQGIFLTSPGNIALMRPEECGLSVEEMVKKYFCDLDIVLMEGYNCEAGFEKVEIIRAGIGRLNPPPDKVVARVSDIEFEEGVKTFKPSEVGSIVDFIDSLLKTRRKKGGN